ncbi:DinB family protein [Paenibacillus sp. YYML68]|uniref:DinB family protein n=1 Tax=Paenibacillus sp. YYML68 TaxID=2909250 RepID=UPI0024939752|nr:DinB family protein [Paenibacillus sp. YYML68]
MTVQLNEAVQLLARTPQALEQLLVGLSDEWLTCNEGEGTWNATEVVEHLLVAERTNWIPRLEWLMKEGEGRAFPPFDRFAHLQQRRDDSMECKLREFRQLREASLARLHTIINFESDLDRTGRHPQLGIVKASELLATWVVHDLTHTSQITRVLANRYRSEVGPWVQYLSILR